jgi:hypothetical protein
VSVHTHFGIKPPLVHFQGGYNLRVKAIHILNAPPYADTFIAALKLVFKSKIADRVST